MNNFFIRPNRLGNRLCVSVCLALPVLAPHLQAKADNCPSNLDDRSDVSSNPSGYDYDVHYTNDDATSSDWFPSERAGWIRDAVSGTHSIVASAPHDFEAPYFSDDPQDVCIYDYDTGVYASAPENRIKVQSTNMKNEPEPWVRKVTGHEMFHHVQYAYINYSEWSSWGTWTIEGTARAMEDKLTLDNDNTAANTAYVGAANGLLGNPNHKSLTDRSYDAALWWTYFQEQLGTAYAEPARGVDAMREFWEQTAGESPDSIGALRRAISALDSDESLENLFTDFQITNFTHDLDLSALANRDRYLYFDESPAGGGTAYDAVDRDTIAAADTTYNASVKSFAGRHFEADVSTKQSCEILGVRGESTDNSELGWAMIGIKNGDEVTELHPGRGQVFYRAVVNTPGTRFDKLGLVVAGLSQDSNFEYAYGVGEASGEIKLPFVDRKAKVGAIGEPPRRFLMRLLIEGPDALTPEGYGPVSVKGLDPSIFDVNLRSDSTGAEYAASILSARYVDGEYWLTIQAPEITNPGDGNLYDLELCFCQSGGDCAQSFTSPKAVLYENEILHQVLTVDRSYSMHYPEPAETAKITAARNAARMYVDAANDDDFLGVATFSGDNAECSNDASLTPLTGGLVTVNGNRSDLRDDIDNIVEDGWTSIGDGIKVARDELLAMASPDDTRAIVLMSDGLENEGDYWASANGACGTPAVKDSFDADLGGMAADIRIDTVAFGSDADQALLQSIAEFTGGLALPVSSDTPAAPRHSHYAASSAVTANPQPNTLEVANRLASAYRTIEEDIRGQDRLHFAKVELTGSAAETYNIGLHEGSGGGVVDGVFAFNWDDDSAHVSLKLRDPHGSLITAATPGWSVHKDRTNTVYHYDGKLEPGNYSVEASADHATEMISALSGRVIHGIDLETNLSQVLGEAPNRECSHFAFHYLRGLPVTVMATLTDSKGGLEKPVRVEATVANPNGEVNRISLYDDGGHDDGEAGDGVYANVYRRTPFFSRGGQPDFPAGPPTGDWGAYSVSIVAEGVSNHGEPFVRFEERGFQVYEFEGKQNGCNPDEDGDQMPDRWERYYGLDPADPSDAHLDPDDDGLVNLKEFLYGTMPRNPDSDGGGESDSSEIDSGRDPLYDGDDLLPPILDFGAITHVFHPDIHHPKPETAILRFPVNPAYKGMQIWRTDPSWSGFQLVKVVDLGSDPSGTFYDTGLINGKKYHYYLVAEGYSGSRTPRTSIFTVVPQADALPPSLGLRINNRNPVTGDRIVRLQLLASDDTKLMQVSNHADFAGASWTAFKDDFAWKLPVGPKTGYTATVYARVMDTTGHTSLSVSASIDVDEYGDHDKDGIINRTDSDDDGDGLSDKKEVLYIGSNPHDKDTDDDKLGDFDEYAHFGTDPTLADTDSDGFTDYKEVKAGSDPLDPLSTP